MVKAKNEVVSGQMSRMPRESTGPEISLRRELHRRGIRFRLHRRDLPGTPDIVLPKDRIAVFVDGCFWHGCAEHGGIPKHNNEWWREKLEKNRERDVRKDRELDLLGWVPIHIWEHETVVEAADRIETVRGARPGFD
jgi:DNA mismatch endonuclease (patch repair protein)